ncbi:MAG TPA: hypothetical protein VGI83_07375, partial [Gemmatimonadales bacterium]
MRNPIRAAVVAALTLAAACIQPLKLAHDDSPVVLARQTLEAPNPTTPGSHKVLTLFYGSGTDKNRREYRDSVSIKTRRVDATKLASPPNPQAGKDRKKYWG